MENEKKLLLFDIDKTLTYGVESHRAAFHAAFEKIYGVKTTVDVIEHFGMTDMQIVIGVLKKNGLSESEINAKLSACKEFLAKEFEKNVVNEHIYATPGARELLDELIRHDDVLLGLITGNIEPIAWGKLKKAGLAEYFTFGAFGSDAIERSELVKIAIMRAKKKFGFKPNRNVFVFGDTPRDIAAGKDAGAITVGVATGDFSVAQLKDAGADFVFKDLTNKDKILKMLKL